MKPEVVSPIFNVKLNGVKVMVSFSRFVQSLETVSPVTVHPQPSRLLCSAGSFLECREGVRCQVQCQVLTNPDLHTGVPRDLKLISNSSK